jgi:hypothetical protein
VCRPLHSWATVAPMKNTDILKGAKL